ncbi:hypothetical protein FKW77_004261 [Venturia effusa]|uniref:Zn(2)-C6 fungal-type domain-containing protein n=1 Tax=Venturia effusa TaxID=50376 RepID=A0A517LQ04_9PEZI|nr:hypothetical protein FKW77_004261 [Venturia effusa]
MTGQHLHHANDAIRLRDAPPPLHQQQQQQQQQQLLKPIRFITNDGGPYAKRRRISSACHTCRRRKTRCTGERPACTTCKEGNQECKGYGPGEGDSTVTSPRVEHHEGRQHTGLATNNQGGEVKSSPRQTPRQIGRGQSPSRSITFSSTSSMNRRSGHEPPPPRRPSSHQTELNDSASSTTYPGNNEDLQQQRTDWNGATPSQASSALTLSIRNRMPYFRYFGPTAIMPGFKQMVVKVHDNRGTTTTSSADERRGSSPRHILGPGRSTPMPEIPAFIEPPVYDTSRVPPSSLIVHLCKTFFTHLGCSFPFLQKERFMRDLEEKQVDAILVDAVCALAARFSNDPDLTRKNRMPSGSSQEVIPPPERGQAFAHRAKSSIVDLFPCPSVAVVQAALLLAYDEFGANRDSGLWMYLGIAIRMAQDLGMQKLEGLRYVGLTGPTPQSLNLPRKYKPRDSQTQARSYGLAYTPENEAEIIELKAIERERVDTFWAVFSLDRYISSGTGRPVTLRDEDIEVAFPLLDEINPDTGWPLPWPALIRIVHLYGRVSDVLNGIKEVSHVTPDVITRLATMEKNLTEIYQGLLPKLHFNAVNFQHYASVGEGTNFIMLHFWFHTLIVLLHQPTLLHTFEDEIQQLFPKSRELSMSSAKTIADILSFAELISGKSALGNPFTSQPTYIAACAFLKESASHAITSKPSSRACSPVVEDSKPIRPSMSAPDIAAANTPQRNNSSEKPLLKSSVDQQLAAKHSLLASAANQNYQRCYRALQQLESCWAGTKYILTVLDQKAKGVVDPILYTREEMESALEAPNPEPSFTAPGWRRKQSSGLQLGARLPGSPAPTKDGPHDPPTPVIDASAIGWSLAGTMNAPKNASLAVLYPPNTREVHMPKPQPPKTTQASIISNPPPPHASTIPPFHRPGAGLSNPPPNMPLNFSTAPVSVDPSRMQDADLLLNLTHTPYNQATPEQLPDPGVPPPPPSRLTNPPQAQQQQQQQQEPEQHQPVCLEHSQQQDILSQATLSQQQQQQQQEYQRMQEQVGMNNYNHMMIESQDMDLSALGDDMTWLEYLPSEPLGGYYGGGNVG